MISHSRFVELLHNLFCHPLLLNSYGFNPHFSTDIQNYNSITKTSFEPGNGKCIWFHEEPLESDDLNAVEFQHLIWHTMSWPSTATTPCMHFSNTINFSVFANSEKSKLKQKWLTQHKILDWYFFFHGFLALDWYRDFKYFPESEYKITKLFICMNHLIYKKRSYRLLFLSYLQEADLISSGYISAPLLDSELVKRELFDSNSNLSSCAKKHVYNNLFKTAKPLILDSVNYNNASADIIDFEYSQGALWHVVTETIFYDEKLHLTEKIFKPIVCRRPFILVGAPGNLAYIKSYGFKTFDHWIDESYDSEHDPDIRIQKITNELVKLSKQDLDKMYQEMQSVLQFNYNHFFNEFREIIVTELVDNFKKCVFLYNKDMLDQFKVPEENLDYKKITEILLKS